MKTLLTGTLALASFIIVSAAAEPTTDPVPTLFREAFDTYKAKEYGPSLEKLREIIAILEKRTEEVLGETVASPTTPSSP